MTRWTSAPPPEPGPDDHVRGSGPLVIEYADLECPFCARAHLILKQLPVRRVFRHFPVISKHPRARALAAAAEAAGLQGRFWEMHDALLEDQGHLDDPHLWNRVEQLGLDIERFTHELRKRAAAHRIADDIEGADLSSVTGTPTFFVNGRRHYGAYDVAALSAAVRAAGARATLTSVEVD